MTKPSAKELDEEQMSTPPSSKCLVLQLGRKSDKFNAWVIRRYLRGLDKTIRDYCCKNASGWIQVQWMIPNGICVLLVTASWPVSNQKP